MVAENYIRVPKEYGRVLGRMGLAEFKIIQENENDIVISAPIEYCRTLKRMGGEFKGITDSDYIFRKATACADASIEEVVLANQSYIDKVSQTGNDCSIEVQYNKLQDLTSPETGLTKKYLCFLVRTNFDTIEEATWNGSTLTSKDVQDSIDMGGTAQDLCWWVAAEDILDSTLSGTISKEGYTSESISITAKDVSVDEVTLTYAMGSYADGGSVPDPVTVERGSTIMTAVYPQPTRTGYGWAGYSTTDGSSEIEYSMASPIVMEEDITLYPVFIKIDPPAPQPTDKLVIDNTNGAVAVIVGYLDDPSPVTVGAGSKYDFVFNADEVFYISFASKPDISGSSASFTGTIGGASYTNEECYLEDTYVSDGAIYFPDGDWMFASGEGGTLTIESTADSSKYHLTIDNSLGDGHILVYDNSGEGSETPLFDIGQVSQEISLEKDRNYGISYDPDTPTKNAPFFTGRYNGQEYSNTVCSVGTDYTDLGICAPNGESSGEWYFVGDDDRGTLTFRSGGNN